MPFVKLDAETLESSLWVEDLSTRIVFLTMLLMARPDGVCPATAPGIARRANLPIDQTRQALAVLEAPDPDSRTQDQDGRRIVRVDGGYEIINYLKYRTKDHGAAARMKRYRASQKDGATDGVTSTDHSVTANGCNATSTVTQAEVEVEAEAEKKKRETRPGTDIPPSWESVQTFLDGLGEHRFNAHDFLDAYEKQGWRLSNGQKMKNWQAAVRSSWIAPRNRRGEEQPRPEEQLSEEQVAYLARLEAQAKARL